MTIVWTPQAEHDRLEIFTYIAMDNPFAAIALDERFGEVVGRLNMFPDSGQPGKISGTRELYPHENYRIVYEVGAAPNDDCEYFSPTTCGVSAKMRPRIVSVGVREGETA